jgi:type 1 glutamine amidotransferase
LLVTVTMPALAMKSLLFLLLLAATGCTQESPPGTKLDPGTDDASSADASSASPPGGGGTDASAGGADASDAGSADAAIDAGPFRVLLFSKTAGFRHDSIPAALAAIASLGKAHGFDTEATEDGSLFTAANLARFQVVAFVMTTGTVLDDGQRAAFEGYIRAGGGYAGIHSATDTEYQWAWYGSLAGTYFANHPAIQQATVLIETHAHPSTSSLPDSWLRTDEWYNFMSNPRGQVTVLTRLDESSYTGGTMGTDHPHSWYHAYDGGRAWYTGGGHTSESYSEPLFLAHLLGGIQYAAGR